MAQVLDEFRLWICHWSEEAPVWQIISLGRRLLVHSEVWGLNAQKFVIDGPEFSAIEKDSPLLEVSTRLGSCGSLDLLQNFGPVVLILPLFI
jgi:hypothetical protein